MHLARTTASYWQIPTLKKLSCRSQQYLYILPPVLVRRYAPGNIPKSPKPPPLSPKPLATVTPRHQIQEGTAALNVPFNPPGAPGGGPEIGGSGSRSVFPLTKSPLFDAALTTIVGLGMG